MTINKRKFLKISGVILALAIGGIAIRIYFAGSLMPDCDGGVSDTATSPDGKWTAEEEWHACGGAPGVSYSQVKLRSGNGDAKTVFDMDGAGKIDLKWTDARHLVIGYWVNNEVSQHDSSLEDITIEYAPQR